MPALQRSLEDFLRSLRDSGVRVSPAEAIDAHRAVAAVGYADRDLMRNALCVTVAKSEEEVERFEDCFDTFFSRRAGAAKPRSPEGLIPPLGAPDLVRDVLQGDEVSIAQAMEAAGQRASASAIRLTTQRNLLVRRILDDMGLRELEAMIHALRDSGQADDEALAERLAFERRDLFRRAVTHVDREARLHASGTARRLRDNILAEQSLSTIGSEDMRAMEALVRRMAKRIASRYARKRRRARRGSLDIRTTIRRSMGHGGLPFDIVWKAEVVHKPKIVVICDVSRSVAPFARFLLLFLYTLGEVVEKLDAYAFSDRLVGVNDVLRHATVEDAMTTILARAGLRPTDYGRSLADFRELNRGGVDRRTIVIILGDGRSNGADPRLDLMREIADRARAVIWLNPEPETFWNQGDSEMHAYLRFCTLARSCNTLKGLEHIVDNVLRTYVPR